MIMSSSKYVYRKISNDHHREMQGFRMMKCVAIRSLLSKVRFWFSRAAAFSKAVVNDTEAREERQEVKQRV